MSRRQRHHYHSTAAASYFGRANNRVFSIVATFYDDIGLQKLDQLERGVFGEHDDEIDLLDRGEDVSALQLAPHGSSRPLQASNRCIAIDPDDKCIGSFASRHQEINVTGMQKIEHTVRERHATLSTGSPPFSLGPGCKLGSRNPGLQRLASTVEWK